MEEIRLLYIDLFCGAGGTSTGVEQATLHGAKCAKVVASEMMRKIKEFMANHCIIDIKMRMLKIPELKAIMGFPRDYVLRGTQRQKKFIGNAVEVNQSRVLCEALAGALEEGVVA